MKRIISMLTAVFMIVGLTACVGNTKSDAPENSTSVKTDASTVSDATESSENTGSSEETEDTAKTSEPEQTQDHKTVLVVVFSATGTTKSVAEKIAAIENADFYEIKAAAEYTSADLNWNDSSSRSTIEQNDKSVRPEIGSEHISLDGYDTVYIGFPIWWGEEPRIMDTFVESYSFDGITVIPFCTSGGSGIGRSGQNLADNAGSGNWLDGKRFSGGVSEDELRSWIDGLK